MNKLETRQMDQELVEAQEKVRLHTTQLEETNTALRVLLKEQETYRTKFEEKILSNITFLVLPYLEQLKKRLASTDDIKYLNILETNLKEITSAFSQNLSSKYLGLTPKEIKVAGLVKDGKQDKEICEILNISFETIKTHRQNIRKKLGIYNQRINLKTYLVSRINSHFLSPFSG